MIRRLVPVSEDGLDHFMLGLPTGPEKGDWLTAPDGPGDLG